VGGAVSPRRVRVLLAAALVSAYQRGGAHVEGEPYGEPYIEEQPA
jgi:hypothetical protein